MKKGKEPKRAQKEVLGFLDFPENFKLELESICAPSKKENKIDLNKLEDFLLKRVIPFMRIAHCGNFGTYMKVMGNLIMISSDVVHSLNRILPVAQDLIPVSFKKRLQYQGYFLEEYIDKNKVLAYFKFLKKYNHLYEDVEFNDEALANFEKTVVDAVNKEKDLQFKA